jgi:hypothetical protein
MCLALLATLPLSGCSYAYDVLATVIDGRLAFIVDPQSPNAADCINHIEVVTDEREVAPAATGDDPVRTGYGTYWYEVASYDCENPFPVFYGSALRGGPPENWESPDHVKPKPLKIGVVYEVSTTTGATGYGGGRFRIRPNRTVENLPRM